MTRLYLAVGARWCNRTFGAGWDWDADPLDLLVAFPYVDAYKKRDSRPRSAMLDSGAFSAWNSGKVIDLDALVAETKDPLWDESVALDVIGDGRGSLVNALLMKSRGSPAFPVFHVGEDWGILGEYLAAFPKVGLSCRFGEPRPASLAWLDGCFARGWPHRFHSFGWVDEDVLSRFPFDSCDTASWAISPGRFGQWKAFGYLTGKGHGARGPRLRNVPHGVITYRAEVEYYLRLGRKLSARWRHTLGPLRAATPLPVDGRFGGAAGTAPGGPSDAPVTRPPVPLD